MNKGQFIDAVAAKSYLNNKQAHAAVEAAIEVITESLKSGESVTITGFGTFETRDRAAKTGRNPQTGESISIAAKTVPAFKAGKAFKDAVK